ncbi:DUF488 domain-containing protein [Cupriavidus necator]|uniref:DUF488 domain-containing protein n=1 Tax=Cupriavidus necator TaxID=106590 RepID=UPI00278B4F04|nr:DUF488 domain-containing protein [Cupriavidus necator]MDQ0141225.1 uncharacterized protein (DUF488 family) [Cupriavidus necator]
MTLPFFTIGHSNRAFSEFLGLLSDAGIGALLDIRKLPGSRSNPQYNEAALREGLAAAGISYEHIAALGGLRGKRPALPRAVNGFWTNESFHNYADYALSAEFRTGLEHLIEAGRERRCVMMCSEAVWWRCHRRIVADYLVARGEAVFHIVGRGRPQPARLCAGAVVQPDKTIEYPAAT